MSASQSYLLVTSQSGIRGSAKQRLWSRFLKTGLTSVVLPFLTLGVIPKATAAELTLVRVGVLATGEFCQTYIAQKKGFFAKNGLGVELVYFQGGSQVI